MAEVSELTFELERFEWMAADRLEIVGRWQGLSGRRLGRPLLHVDAGGRRHRLTASPGGQPPRSGERWRAGFAWPHGPAEVEGAELEIGRRLVVELPAPRRRRRRPGDGGADQRLRDELAELRERHERLQAEHAALADRHAALIAGGGELRGELAAALSDQQRLSEELRELREAHEAGASQREDAERRLEEARAATAGLRAKLAARKGTRTARAVRPEPAAGAATNGGAAASDTPGAATAAGAAAASDTSVAATAAGAAGRRRASALLAARSEVDQREPYRRAGAARAAAAQRVPEPEPSTAGVWATRAAAIALLAVLLLSLAIIVTTLA